MNKKEGKGKNTKPKDNNTISNNLLKFPKKITNNDTKKYESFNVLSETGDSIYGLLFEEQIGGQIFVAESKIEEIVNRIIDRGLDPL
ncbi:MAG: hypothetical protein ACM3VV_04485 [Deltaproteobacteria bacterium]